MTPTELRDLLRGEPLPAALVDLDAFDRNAERMAELLRKGGFAGTLRVATKSIRVPDLLRRVLERGAPYKGLMCYSAREAAFLAEQGFDDLLVAYPTLHPAELAALWRVHSSGRLVRLVADSEEGLKALAEAMGGSARPFPVVVEADAALRAPGLHLGARRSPLRTPEEVVRLGLRARELGLAPSGLLCYEAQVAGLPDRLPGRPLRNAAASALRRLSARLLAPRRRALREAWEAAGLPLEVFNGGGTASLGTAAAEGWLTELTTGSGLFCPALFDSYSDVRLEPAGFFALEAVRRPAPGLATCRGGGYVASGSAGPEKLPLPWSPAGTLLAAEGAGETQTPVRVSEEPPLGGPVLFRHAKAGELMERFDEALLASGGRLVGRARTYRGHGRSFG